MTLGGSDLENGVPKDMAFQDPKSIFESIQAKGARVIMGILSALLGARVRRGIGTAQQGNWGDFHPQHLRWAHGKSAKE
jgi:hypothetical protein